MLIFFFFIEPFSQLASSTSIRAFLTFLQVGLVRRFFPSGRAQAFALARSRATHQVPRQPVLSLFRRCCPVVLISYRRSVQSSEGKQTSLAPGAACQKYLAGQRLSLCRGAWKVSHLPTFYLFYFFSPSFSSLAGRHFCRVKSPMRNCCA